MPKKSNAPVRRRSDAGKKWKDKLAASRRRRASERKERLKDMSVVGGGAFLGAWERWGPAPVLDIPFIPDAGLYGLIAWGIGDYMSGKAGDVVQGMGVGMMTCAVRDVISDEIEPFKK